MKRTIASIAFVGTLLGIVGAKPVCAQVNYGDTKTIYIQDFNALSASKTGSQAPLAWSNDITIPGWYAFTSTASNVKAVTGYRGDNGTDTTGALYSYGATGVKQRALGGLPAAAIGDVTYEVGFRNTTGKTLHSFTFAYTGEQWRTGGSQTAAKLVCSYIVGVGNWTHVTSMDFTGPKVGAAAALDGSLTANQKRLSVTIVGTVWQPDQFLWVRWVETHSATADHALAIDDFKFYAN